MGPDRSHTPSPCTDYTLLHSTCIYHRYWRHTILLRRRHTNTGYWGDTWSTVICSSRGYQLKHKDRYRWVSCCYQRKLGSMWGRQSYRRGMCWYLHKWTNSHTSLQWAVFQGLNTGCIRCLRCIHNNLTDKPCICLLFYPTSVLVCIAHTMFCHLYCREDNLVLIDRHRHKHTSHFVPRIQGQHI